MSKFVETSYGSTTEILKFPDHYIALAIMVSDDSIPAVNGKKIVPKGTIVGGKDNPAITNLNAPVVNKFTSAAQASEVFGSTANNNAIVITALEPGEVGEDIKVEFVKHANDTPTKVAIVVAESAGTTTITVKLVVNAGSTILSTANDVIAAINGDEDAAVLVVAALDEENVPSDGDEPGDGVCGEIVAKALDDGSDGAATGAEGVLLNDIDVTHGDAEGAMVIHGFIAIDKLPYGIFNGLAAAAAGAILKNIKFIK